MGEIGAGCSRTRYGDGVASVPVSVRIALAAYGAAITYGPVILGSVIRVVAGVRARFDLSGGKESGEYIVWIVIAPLALLGDMNLKLVLILVHLQIATVIWNCECFRVSWHSVR